MSPVALLLILACVWALTNLWFLPLTRDRWLAADLREKMIKAGTVVVVEKLRDLSAIGCISLAALIVLIGVTELLAGSDVTAPVALLAAINSLYAVAKGWAEEYGGVVTILGLAGIVLTLYYAAKHAKGRVAQAWSEKAAEIHAQLMADIPAGLEKAAANPRLRPACERIAELFQALGTHERALQALQETEPGPVTHLHAEGMLTDDAVSEINSELSANFSMLAIEMAKDQVNMESAIATPTEGESQETAGWWARCRRVLVSTRFSKDIGLIKKPMSYVITGLLFATLLGWAGEPLADGLQHAVNKLKVNAVAQDADTMLQAALGKPDKQPATANTPALPSGATTQAVSRALARAVTQAMLHSDMLDHAVQLERSPVEKREFVQHALVGQQIASDAGVAVDSVRKEVADIVAADSAEDASSQRVAAHVEEKIRPHIEALKRENPERFAALAARLDARYGGPTSPFDAQSKLFGRIIDHAMGGLDAGPATEIGKQAQNMARDFGEDAIKTWVDAFTKQYVVDAVVGAARPDVRHAMARNVKFEGSQQTHAFLTALHDAHGRGWAAAMQESDEAAMSKAVASKIADLNPNAGGDAGELMQRMAGYESTFPIDNLPGPGLSASGGGHGSGAPRKWTSFRFAATSARVRGVLLGREIANHGLDLRDIRWRIAPGSGATPTMVTIELLANGVWTSIGTFPAAVVNQALRFAGDNRVVATTIAPGDGTTIARITLLHPALVDTPMGCRVVESDRFIDTFSMGSARGTAGPFANLSADRRVAHVWQGVIGIAEKVAAIPSTQACPKATIEKVFTEAKVSNVRYSPALMDSIERFVKKQEADRPGSTAFLRAAHACATGNGSIAACLCSNVRGTTGAGGYWVPVDHTSQFRERETSAGQDTGWLQPSKDRLAHVELWVHTTFALHKLNPVTHAIETDEDASAALDFPPDQLKALRAVVSEQLPRYIAKQLNSPSYDDFMAPMEEFIVLQRLFRAVLGEELGKNFPTNKLIALRRDTAKFVPFQPTIRWEPMPGQAERFQKTLAAVGPKAKAAYSDWRNDHLGRQLMGRAACDPVSK